MHKSLASIQSRKSRQMLSDLPSQKLTCPSSVHSYDNSIIHRSSTLATLSVFYNPFTWWSDRLFPRLRDSHLLDSLCLPSNRTLYHFYLTDILQHPQFGFQDKKRQATDPSDHHAIYQGEEKQRHDHRKDFVRACPTTMWCDARRVASSRFHPFGKRKKWYDKRC